MKALPPPAVKPIQWDKVFRDHWPGVVATVAVCSIKQQYLDQFELNAIWGAQPYWFPTLGAAQQSAQAQWQSFIQATIQS